MDIDTTTWVLDNTNFLNFEGVKTLTLDIKNIQLSEFKKDSSFF